MYKIYGENTLDKAPSENAEQATFFNTIRVTHPEVFSVAIHIPNEGKRTAQQIDAMKLRGGYIKGASDIFIPGRPSLLIELKSRAKNSRPSKEQIKYLEDAAKLGSMCCVCYGYKAAIEALEDWIKDGKK